ncbi:MAG: DUF3634 family protein [Labilithrix sp.]|nr:DUF3634 family protein [Labilithrix sp.]MCW5813182.1 DUF3634 family protein [Labilithrix sp.]
MDMLVWVAVVAGVLGALYVAATRAITVCELAIEDGAVRVVRGGVAPPILADLRDVARTPKIARLRVRIVRSSGRAEVQLRGDVPAPQAQRIRNVVGSVPLARLANSR